MEKFKIYLAGAIEFSPDHGAGIRQQLINEFKDTNFELINPCDFEYNQAEFPTLLSYQKEESHNFSDCLKNAIKVSNGDIKSLSNCHALISVIDEFCGTGTASEMSVANILGIPIFSLIKNSDNWRNINPWILGQTTFLFYSINDLKEYIINEYDW